MHITKGFVRDCSLILGRFDSVRVEKLVTLYQHQSSGSQLSLLSKEVREKFENLLTIKNTDQADYPTPLTRVELAVMNDFKNKYLAEPVLNSEKKLSKSSIQLYVNDELSSAYCYLLAQVDDRIVISNLNELKFILGIRMAQSPDDLFDIYQASGDEIANFFTRVRNCGYFQERNVIIIQLIESFQLFIQRYNEFLIIFQKCYQSSPEHGSQYTQIDAIMNNQNNQQTSLLISSEKPDDRKSIEEISQAVASVCTVSQPKKEPISQSKSQSISATMPYRKGLCVIINIMEFVINGQTRRDKRAGSEKDVDMIRSAFLKLNFTILQCGFNFKESDVNTALHEIDDPTKYGHYECLVVFVMSHGYLHSFFTADQKAIAIRDVIRRYCDSSSTTIWKGKTRMFFIQACRSPWPNRQQPTGLLGIKQSDLSSRMLVAFSCSEEESSKRLPQFGSIFIQMLCIMIIRYGHNLCIQEILRLTHLFVTSYDKLSAHVSRKEISLQRPEYIEHNFDRNFRFSSKCVYDEYNEWDKESKNNINLSVCIWKGLYSQIFENNLSIRN